MNISHADMLVLSLSGVSWYLPGPSLTVRRWTTVEFQGAQNRVWQAHSGMHGVLVPSVGLLGPP